MKTKIILLLALLLPVIYINAQSNKLFGSYWTGSEEIFTSLDMSTKTYTDIDTLVGVLTLNSGESTFDSDNGRYFRKTNLGITIIDAQNGAIIDTIANSNNMKGIEFPNKKSRLEIIENAFANELFVYPNPTNGLVNINLQTSYTNLAIEVINTIGQIIYKQNFNKSTDLKLDLTELVVGVYFVKIYAEDKSTTIKLMKK